MHLGASGEKSAKCGAKSVCWIKMVQRQYTLRILSTVYCHLQSNHGIHFWMWWHHAQTSFPWPVTRILKESLKIFSVFDSMFILSATSVFQLHFSSTQKSRQVGLNDGRPERRMLAMHHTPYDVSFQILQT